MPYYNTCPDCGAHLDPSETCDCQITNTEPKKGEKTMNHEDELRALAKELDIDTIRVLNKLIEAMLTDQKAQEAKKYESLLASPAELADIIAKDRDDVTLKTGFACDAIRYYINLRTPVPFSVFTDAGKALQLAYFLFEAGRIVGTRQERARKTATA